ncbi:hypothetical protein RB653_002880 [Dictyostelium firmibasis]|uniref:Transmembrane protein n=1 Tax=Dictyostelium firmibasis TaxID=79012 RepID=A0AAN7TXA1_9MYCE
MYKYLLKNFKRQIEFISRIYLFIKKHEHHLRKLFVILQVIISIVLISLSITTNDHDDLFDSWYYFTCHLILSLFGIFVFFKKSTNSRLLYLYVILLSGLLITASFSFFWYSGQLNIIENTCVSDQCNYNRAYYKKKTIKIIALIVVEAVALHPNLSWLIQVLKKERKLNQLNTINNTSDNLITIPSSSSLVNTINNNYYYENKINSELHPPSIINTNSKPIE